nr:MAG: replication associated protein [Cressdnaviricota sp.]
MSVSSSKEIQRLGNTKQVSPAKKWCFTLNNYNDNDISKLLSSISSEDLYVIGKEIAPTTNTPHLQGFIEFKNKSRPSSIVKFTNKIHWEKCKGSFEQNYEYCIKGENYITNIKLLKKNLPYCIQRSDFNDLSEFMYSLFIENKFGIWWFYEIYGGIGKSQFIHWMLINHPKEVLLLGQGKYADIINGIYNTDMTFVRTILIDLPRENTGFVSLGAMESILDSHIYNTKFEGGFKVFGKVNVIIMSNSYPKNARKLSARKWNIFHIANCARYEEEISDINETIWED